MANIKLTDNDLSAIIVGYESERDRIAARIVEIRQILSGGRSEPAVSTETAKPRKKRSAAVRRKMALAQRARYARLKQDSEPAPAAKPKKRKLSAAGKAAIVAALKKRWADVKAAKQAEKPAAMKKTGRKGPKKAAKKVIARKPKTEATAPEQATAVNA
jgi:hypothetical protein